MLAHFPEMVVLEAAEETDLGEVDDFGAPFGAVIEVLKGRPVLGAYAEQVHAETNVRR